METLDKLLFNQNNVSEKKKKVSYHYQWSNDFPSGFHLFNEFKQKENTNVVFL